MSVIDENFSDIVKFERDCLVKIFECKDNIDYQIDSISIREKKSETQKELLDNLIDSRRNLFKKFFINYCKSKKLLKYSDSFSDDLEKYFTLTENHGISYLEKEIVDFIKELKIDIIENDRTVIAPKELDIYIPSKKVAIEFDGLYYHSELFVTKDYHLAKTNTCNEKGIDLIHVFEDDWIENKEIVKSMIKSRLGIYDRKIFARKCEIRVIDKDVAKVFFKENHLQGFASTCDLHLGLFYEDELVQAISITFNGWHDGNVELTRMVTKSNTQVIGGFSKLVSYFCKTYNCSSLTSYVYKAWFNGKGYLASGFKIIKENKPSYSYILNKKRFHKSNFRKDKLK